MLLIEFFLECFLRFVALLARQRIKVEDALCASCKSVPIDISITRAENWPKLIKHGIKRCAINEGINCSAHVNASLLRPFQKPLHLEIGHHAVGLGNLPLRGVVVVVDHVVAEGRPQHG